MTITLQVNGVRYDGWTDVTIMRNIEHLSGSFSFGATSNNITSFPVKAGQPCQAFIGDTMVINGYVDAVNVSYSATDHSIVITGRDRTCDLIDGTIVGVSSFQGMELIPIIEKVLVDHDLSDIKVINKAGDITAAFPDKIRAGSPISQTIFSFLEGYARKRQVLLTGDGKGNIVLARAAIGSAQTTLTHIISNISNNIKSATVTYDFTKRFYKYILQSGQTPTSVEYNNPEGEEVEDEGFDDTSDDEADATNASVAIQTGTAFDDIIRKSRVTEIVSKTTDSSVDLDELAEWTKNLAIARSIEYEAEVFGFYHDAPNKLVWEPNILVQVIDDFTKINATMLIKSVEYKLNLSTGSTTKICLVDKNSYILQLQVESETEKKKSTKGNSLGVLTFTPPN